MKTVVNVCTKINYFLAWFTAMGFDPRLAFLVFLTFFPVVGVELVVLARILDFVSPEIGFKLTTIIVGGWFVLVLFAMRLKWLEK